MPFELLHGYKPSVYGIALRELATDYDATWKKPCELRANVWQHLREEQERSNQEYGHRHFPEKLRDVAESVHE